MLQPPTSNLQLRPRKPIVVETPSVHACYGRMVIWFYTRNQQSLTLETRFDNSSNEFVAIITGLAPAPMTKRFSSVDMFQEWIEAMEHDLAEQHWKAEGAPHILADGWRDNPWTL